MPTVANPARILIVDDELNLTRLISHLLTSRDMANRTCNSGDLALKMLQAEEFELVISDITMPGMSGIELLSAAKREHPDIAFIMLTAIDDHATAVRALELGAYGYIVKPFKANELYINISVALRRRELELERNRYEERLEDEVRERTADIRTAQEQIILRLMTASGYRDEETGDHIRRMGEFAALLASADGWTASAVDQMRLAATMHDVGKIGIADAILRKPGPLTADEFSQIKEHARIGARILEGSGIPLLDLAGTIALSHHEKWDGNGYPDALAGDSIPEAARIVAICDVYDALVNDRVYRKALAEEQALDIMRNVRGTHFDPRLFDIFLENLSELRAVRARITG